MSKTRVIFLAASVTFITGLTGGLAIGARRDFPDQTAPSPRSPARDLQRDALLGIPGPAVPLGDSRQGPAGAKVDAPTEILEVALELWNLMTSKEPKEVPPAERRKRLRELRPEMAAFFIGKFREADKNDVSKQMALDLAISCGGPGAVAFLEELYAGKADRVLGHYLRIAVSVVSEGHLLPRPNQFPVGESLMGLSRGLLVSGDREDRRMAIAVLGFSEPCLALPVLSEVVKSDVDVYVRMAAVRELGRLGDAATLANLQAQRDSLASAMQKLSKPVQQAGGVTILAPHVIPRAIDDAIEELEERLQKR